MKTKEDIQQDLENARREYRKVASILAMMEKGTKGEEMVKMRKEQLDPIKMEMKKLEEELASWIST